MKRSPLLSIAATIIAGVVWIDGALANSDSPDTITVAVASNFMVPMKVIAEEFEQQTGHQVVLVAGSSGKLYAQIRNGAPYDLFFSADSAKPLSLADVGHANADNIYTYALGRLVLWTGDIAKYDHLPMREALSRVDQDSRLAIANSQVAPYGVAALEVLDKLEMSDRLDPFIVRGQSVSQAFHYAEAGVAEFGLIAASQLQLVGTVTGKAWEVPAYLHEPIRQDVALLKAGEDNPVAKQFHHWFASPEAREKIRSFGYDLEPVEQALSATGNLELWH